ncbi:MAG: hypothetical protein GF421_09645 [Candidatus Aminicenantes bacterium]|nr:hypothetical protein [Candidatus Aminicenantes bacterium]
MNPKGCVLLLSVLVVLGLLWNGEDLYASKEPSEEKLDLLSGLYSSEELKQVLVLREEWNPFPRADERDEWKELPDEICQTYIKEAEQNLGCDWETLKASVFLEYVRTGNRSHYQGRLFNRRRKLAELVLGECMEGKGRFMDDIMNGVWAICEETYWGVPAHLGLQERGNGLPDVTEPTVDLFAAETGTLIAWTYYLVGKQLDETSPLVTERMEYEIKRRILTPNLKRDDFWWMGFDQKVNNWNPWICSNWLTSVLVIEDDPERRAESVNKILRCLDNFLNPYPRDGGCDEGPGYWNRAGGSLFDCLELLYSASNGKIDVFSHPLIKKIGEYICRVYIHYPYFINFADAAAKVSPNASVVFRYGEHIEDEKLKRFGAFLAEKQNLGQGPLSGGFGVLGRVLHALFTLEDMLEEEPMEPLQRDFWLSDLQVMGARSVEGSNQSFYIACKGGHNDESHNHNDVGNFIVYSEGYPVLIDVGVETYTAKTFSSQRYEIWTMQSAFHNLPTINGVMQKNGEEYKSSNVQYEQDNNKAVFRLDISKAYPEEALVQSWKRQITLKRKSEVVIKDEFEIEEVKQDAVLNLMTWRKPEIERNGVIGLVNPEQLKSLNKVHVLYPHDKFVPQIETIAIDDSRLEDSWGHEVYRIQLIYQNTPKKGAYWVRIR